MNAKTPKRNRSKEPSALQIEHERAHLAYLLDLIIHDEEFDGSQHVRALANHAALQNEDAFELAVAAENLARQLCLPPIIFAYGLIQWFAQSDLSPCSMKGSANWSIEAPHIGFDRSDLIQRFEMFNASAQSILKNCRLDPDECLDECIRLNRELGKLLARGQSNLAKLKGRRKQLFYAVSKVKVKAFYLSEIRGLNLDSHRIQELLAEDEASYDLRQTSDRIAAQKQIYEWCRSMRVLMQSVGEDLQKLEDLN